MGELESLGVWGWLAVGIAMIAIDVFLASIYLMWIGVAALTVGLLLVAMPRLSWEWQLLILAVNGLIMIFCWKKFWRSRQDSDQPDLNPLGALYLGFTYPLHTAIENGRGQVNVDDTLWTVLGPELPVGAMVRLLEVVGGRLHVEPIDAG